MASDIILDGDDITLEGDGNIALEGDGNIVLNSGDWVTIQGAVLKVKASDLILEQKEWLTDDGGPYRRALVHNSDDSLAINFDGDYPGGVTIIGARLHLKVDHQTGSPKLPRNAERGELKLILSTIRHPNGQILHRETSLWLCVGRVESILPSAAAEWRQIPLGESVAGTE